MLKEIAKILRNNGNSKCVKKALEIEGDSQANSLHLKSLDLNLEDITSIAAVLKKEKDSKGTSIRSISFSYNVEMGDEGAKLLINSLPSSIREIGFVDCGIGDAGGKEILRWIKKSLQLRLICVEQNNFSKFMKIDFRIFKTDHPNATVIY